MNTLFYIASAVALLATIMAISRKNAVHALMYVILSFLAISACMYLIGAPFAAALEVIIYAGAIMVLFIFVVMMLHTGKEPQGRDEKYKPSAWIFPALLSAVLLAAFVYAFSQVPSVSAGHVEIPPKQVGISMFSTYLLGVEIAAMLLLTGIVGAYHLGRERKKATHRYLINQKENSDADSAG